MTSANALQHSKLKLEDDMSTLKTEISTIVLNTCDCCHSVRDRIEGHLRGLDYEDEIIDFVMELFEAHPEYFIN